MTEIHKPGNPGRPILSGNGSPTENISLFVDYHIKPLVSRAPSYIHDTPEFLRKLNDIKDQIPETAIIGTLDVSSLYTNIPHDEGIQASCEALTASGHSSPPISDIKSLMSHVLTKNNFTFMDQHYLQIFGTAMGTRMAPSFACLFMTKLEQQMLDSAPCRPWIWWRYIDDIFFIWTREEDSLHTFIDHINSFHRTIKFTSDFSQQETHFLDVTVQKKPNGITTTLYTKPTYTHQYLHSPSCHPVTAKLASLTVKPSDFAHGTFKCTSKRCIICEIHIHEGDTLTSNSTSLFHRTKGNITCTTTNVVYLITCRVCRVQYVGETKTTLKKRFYGHRSTVNTAKLDTPVGRHFNLPNHSITDMMLQGIESLGTRPDSVRTSREKFWMRRLRTIQPHGLNIQEGND
ncbi:uncharacterized protein LOC121421826 [Lytechinus variegatus]|uniref:uncharacterized protein LOC121421826 n=1 Tax=Lytechinus variegatus TaxID=7654 RepID=UPI001BB29157|nr:uncharacterized protein LOC121421826 [Lytechinus variegatus]